jgi:hypothetical protein
MKPIVARALIPAGEKEEAPSGFSRILGAGLFMLLLAVVLAVTLLRGGAL